MTGFKHPALAQLTDQQVRFAPPARRQEQLARAEKLLAEIDPAKQYPYQFVCYRITDFRPESYPDLLIAGADLLDDLPLMIQALVVQTPLPAAVSPADSLRLISASLTPHFGPVMGSLSLASTIM